MIENDIYTDKLLKVQYMWNVYVEYFIHRWCTDKVLKNKHNNVMKCVNMQYSQNKRMTALQQWCYIVQNLELHRCSRS